MLHWFGIYSSFLSSSPFSCARYVNFILHSLKSRSLQVHRELSECPIRSLITYHSEFHTVCGTVCNHGGTIHRRYTSAVVAFNSKHRTTRARLPPGRPAGASDPQSVCRGNDPESEKVLPNLHNLNLIGKLFWLSCWMLWLGLAMFAYLISWSIFYIVT